MSEMIGRVQEHFKSTSSDVALFMLRLVSGLVIGLVFAEVMQEIMGKADGENLIAFLFVIIISTVVFLRVTKTWGLAGVLVFDLVAVLLGLVLRLYIMVAPGA